MLAEKLPAFEARCETTACVQRCPQVNLSMTRAKNQLFPTVHVHDGVVHETAAFGHAICTTEAHRASVFGAFGVDEGSGIPQTVTKTAAASEWLSGEMQYPMSDGAGTSHYHSSVDGNGSG